MLGEIIIIMEGALNSNIDKKVFNKLLIIPRRKIKKWEIFCSESDQNIILEKAECCQNYIIKIRILARIWSEFNQN